MKQSEEIPMTFEELFEESRGSSDDGWATPVVASEEVEWLMSLALDNALNEREAARLEYLLQQEPANMERWAAWQMVDSAFQEAPRAIPSPEFGQRFAHKLEIRERQRRLRTGILFGMVAVVLWLSALAGIVTLGALAWSSQGAWVGEAFQDIVYWWSAVGQLGRALLNTGEALWSAPQTRALFVCYLVTVVAILSGWFMFLRHSTHEMPLSEAQMIEA